MIEPRFTSPLLFVPKHQYVEARVVTLTTQMADRMVHGAWWNEPCLKERFDPEPIDRNWDWKEIDVEYDGRLLKSEKVALMVSDQAVEGAMLLSTEPVESVLDPGEHGLFLERLATAPRNRPGLRRDEAEILKGVGTELLTWAAWFSRENGYRGRLLLDGSPDFTSWYEKRGLQALGLSPILYQGIEYTPMELVPAAAEKELLGSWE